MNNDTSMRSDGLSRAAKCGIVFLVIAVALSMLAQMFLASFFSVRAVKMLKDNVLAEKPETFKKDGMSITLTESFEAENDAHYTITYISEDVDVLVSRVPYDRILYGETRTLNGYAELIKSQNPQIPDIQHKHTDGLNYLEFQEFDETTEETLCCIISLYKSEDAFWMVSFVCSEEYMQEHRAELIAYAQSVRFE